MVRQKKVCTTRRSKERRIRLSAKTAIQFYDVQDRLGYDRASMAIDWLMKEAKGAIDALHAHHQDRLPLTSTIFNPTQTFHHTPYDQNQQNSNQDQASHSNSHPFTLANPFTRCPQDFDLFPASKTPLGFSLKPNYERGESHGFVSREPLQSSFASPSVHTLDHGFVNDNGLLEFCSQQELQEDDQKDNDLVVVPGHFPSSNTLQSGIIMISKEL